MEWPLSLGQESSHVVLAIQGASVRRLCYSMRAEITSSHQSSTIIHNIGVTLATQAGVDPELSQRGGSFHQFSLEHAHF